jgi:hypothetical protein
MDDLDDLDPHGQARHTDPDTSHDAADIVDAKTYRKIMVMLLEKYERISQGLNIDPIVDLARPYIPAATLLLRPDLRASLSPRTAELKKAGIIYDSGVRRKSKCGVDQIVWRLTKYRPPDLTPATLAGTPQLLFEEEDYD